MKPPSGDLKLGYWRSVVLSVNISVGEVDVYGVFEVFWVFGF